MQEEKEYRRQFTELSCCVIIPTYNNDHALKSVIDDVLNYTGQIIVVNDGSTDSTARILEEYSHLEIITLAENSGKGLALQQGFRRAEELGYRYAITIDSDGQHFPEDIPLFLDTIRENPGSLILGARNMEQDDVPGTSNFGHSFSIFWFWVETGFKVPDVQTGFRLYPVSEVNRFRHIYSRKYEYEVEILVRLAWRGIKILSVPVKVYYAPKEQRVSHFRKFRDFSRVSVANSLLVFAALLWFRPIAIMRSLRKMSVRQFYRDYIVNSEDSNAKLAKSIALGLFMGVMPIWGWQIVTTIGLAHVLRLNKVISVTFSNISLPPVLPVILFLSFALGGLVTGEDLASIRYTGTEGLSWITENLTRYILGSLLLGVVLAGTVGPLSYLLLRIFRKGHG